MSPGAVQGVVMGEVYCTVLYCTVQGVVMLEVPGSSNKDPPWSAWRLVNHYSAVLRQQCLPPYHLSPQYFYNE